MDAGANLVHDLGLEVRIVRSSLVALGLIADYDPEVLWIDGLDEEMRLDEILYTLHVPRRIRPIAVVISTQLSREYPDLHLGESDEILDPLDCRDHCSQILQLVKVTRLERQVIQREHEIMDSLPHAMFVIDRTLTLWKVNKRLAETLDITDPDYRKKALGRPLGSGFALAGLPMDGDTPLPHLVHELEQCVRSGRKRFRVKERVHASERLFTGELTPLVHSPEHILVDLRDITADEQAVLVEARRERLATIGNLSVGVAHEIQNPNTFSRVNAANLKMMFEAIKPVILQASNAMGGKLGNMPAPQFLAKVSEAIDAVDMASRRIEAVLGTLKSFGRQDDGKLESVDVRAVVNEAEMLVRHEARGKCEVFINLPKELPRVTAAATGLSQVFVNLLQNAVHALSDPKIAQSNKAPKIEVRCEAVNEDEVILSVADNGPGVPDTLRDKVFRPYFTTKPQGQGTGLGLSISTDMMHRFGGDLTLDSRAGQGATFYIKLRRHDVSPDNQ